VGAWHAFGLRARAQIEHTFMYGWVVSTHGLTIPEEVAMAIRTERATMTQSSALNVEILS
jgi:hypothetical protein